MRFVKSEIKDFNKSIMVKISSKSKKDFLWILKLTIFSFLLSLFLSIFSELFLTSSNMLFACLLLFVFMILNIVSDMLGLAIVSCQIEVIKRSKFDNKLEETCIRLINNSDKVSSVLCDVIGDACGILCGVSGSIVAIIFSSKIALTQVSYLLTGAIVSSFIVGLTVLLKAISKKYAVNHSVKIVKKIAMFILKFKRQRR